MIQLFKSNNPATIFALLLVAILLRMPYYFIHPVAAPFIPTDSGGYVLFHYFISVIANNAMLYAIVSLLLLLAQAIAWNSLLNNFRFMPQQNYLVALQFITFGCLLPDFIGLSQNTFAVFVLLWIINTLVQIYRKEKQMAAAFNLGFAIGLLTLLAGHYIVFGLFVFFALLILRPMLFAEWLNFLLGVFIPLFLVGTWCFYTDRFPVFLHSIFQNIRWHSHGIIVLNPSFFIASGSTILLVSVNYFLLNSRQLSRLVLVRKFFNVLFHLCWITASAWFLSSDGSASPFYILAIPLSFYFAYYLCLEKKSWKANLFYGSWVAAILISQYFNQLKLF